MNIAMWIIFAGWVISSACFMYIFRGMHNRLINSEKSERDIKDLEDRMRMMKRDWQRLSERSDMSERELSRCRQQVYVLERRIAHLMDLLIVDAAAAKEQDVPTAKDRLFEIGRGE